MRLRRIPPLLVAILVAGALIGAAISVVLMNPPGGPIPPYEVSLSVDGSLVVGADVTVSATVRYRLPSSWDPGYLFLTILGLGSFEVLSEVDGDDPWNLAGTWNLTGTDLTNGRAFALNTTPVWAAEMVIGAFVWSPKDNNLSNVQFDSNPPAPSLNSINVMGLTSLRLTTQWPLNVQLTVDGNLSVGNNTALRVRVQGTLNGPLTPELLFLSLGVGEHLRIVSTNDDDDPWASPAVWNLTGMDLSMGAEFSLVVTADACGDSSLGLGAWSLRTNWTAVEVDQSGFIQNGDTVRLWASRTIALRIC